MNKTLYSLVSKEPRDKEFRFLDEDHELRSFPDPEMIFESLEEANRFYRDVGQDFLDRIHDDDDSPWHKEQVHYLEHIKNNLKVVKLEVSFAQTPNEPLFAP